MKARFEKLKKWAQDISTDEDSSDEEEGVASEEQEDGSEDEEDGEQRPLRAETYEKESEA